MIWLRSLTFSLFILPLWTGITGVISVPLLAIRSHPTLPGIVWAKGALTLLRIFCSIRYEVKGKENLPDGPCIIASKHQSEWDTIVFFLILKQPCYILKKELLKFPVVGQYAALMGMIPIDRSQGAKAIKSLLKTAKKRIEQNYSIIIFPEGTRALPGQKKTYKPGITAFYKASSIKAPVVPVALNSGYYWQHKTLLKKPGVITLEFLPAIESGLESKAFLEKLEETVEMKCEALAPTAKRL